jgi:hypothetical protein
MVARRRLAPTDVGVARIYGTEVDMKRLLLVLALSACGEEASRDRWAGTVDTLPGGTVRVTNPAEGLWGEEDGWRLVPEVVLGVVEGPAPLVFGVVSGLEVDGRGRIYVLDRQANELRIFAPDGGHLRSVGRMGGGPGEYQNANGLVWLAPDSLLVVDQAGERFSVLTGDGDYVRSVPRQLGFFGWVFSGTYHGGHVYEYASIGDGASLRPALVRIAVADPTTSPSPPALTPGDGDVPFLGRDTTFLPEPAGPVYEALSVRTERGATMVGIPWAPGPVYHVDRHGELWYGHGSEFKIVRLSTPTRTMEIVLEAAPDPISQTELAEWEGSERLRRFREMGGRVDRGSLPTVKPHFSGLYVDPDGYLWVTVPTSPEGTAFAVFDPESRYLGRLRVDGATRVGYLPIVVRNDRLHFVARDGLGVQRVYGFRIER